LNHQEESSLSQTASTAHCITGKAISDITKGAAVGGPCGAAAGLALSAKQHAGKILASIAGLLMLPILFVLMLPSLIFGELTSSGKLVVAIMSKGHFTSSGHFIALRGVQDGKILVADPVSTKRSGQLWDLSIILNEASKHAGAGGPFWIVSRENGHTL